MQASEVLRKMRVVLGADETLAGLVTASYDAPPESPVFPFMTTGESQSYPQDSMSGQGMSHTISINCWSTVSKAECRKIVEAIYPILHRRPIDLDSNNRVDFEFVQMVTTFEPENRLYRGMIRFRAYVYPTT
ncbi:MAG: DUF3168 domain-containing protein [Cytophagaceae bacterium]|nr:MAG: DUF3168 domain-containing protein [Cytophagaceae bacterium]